MGNMYTFVVDQTIHRNESMDTKIWGPFGDRAEAEAWAEKERKSQRRLFASCSDRPATCDWEVRPLRDPDSNQR